MTGHEQQLVAEAFQTNWVSTVGPHLTAFEGEFQERIGLPAVALSSGTAALHLALRLAGVGPGDEVVCPTLTFVASANPIRYLGATPVFIDSERRSWNLDPNLLEVACKERARPPKAVVVVHLFGQTADMEALCAICERYGVALIEDAAEALGARHGARPAGSFGVASAFSFNGNKIITTSGGGMLMAASIELADKARFWSQQAREPGIGFEHAELGYNYRLSNLLAGVGRAQLRVLDERVKQRRAIAFRYRDALRELGGFELMPQAPWGLHTNWLSCFLVDSDELGCSRDDLIVGLSEREIEARPVWKPLHLQPLYHTAECYGGHVAHDLHERGICLPSSSFLDTASQARVIEGISEIVHRRRELRARRPA